MKKCFFFAIMVGLMFMVSAVASEAQPIKIGAVINLTGPASTWGQYHAKGHRDYVNYVNDVKGGIAGRNIELEIVDHAYKVQGVKFVKKFCEEKKDMIATWDTGTGIQIKPLIQEYKIPTINYSVGQAILKPPIVYVSSIWDIYLRLLYCPGVYPKHP